MEVSIDSALDSKPVSNAVTMLAIIVICIIPLTLLFLEEISLLMEKLFNHKNIMEQATEKTVKVIVRIKSKSAIINAPIYLLNFEITRFK